LHAVATARDGSEGPCGCGKGVVFGLVKRLRGE
jgi:hypothetical protein